MTSARAVLFDLDGTLADSLADIAASINACLANEGLPTHDEATVRSFIGHGIEHLVAQALGERADERLAPMLAAVRAHYAEHCTAHTRLYPGIADLLQTLAAQRVPMAVVSNKPHTMTVRVVAALMPDVPFGFVTGARPETPRKPDPTGILSACAALNVSPSAALYVGDTPVDMEAARAAGLQSVAVVWGFRDRETLRAAAPDHWAEHPSDITTLVG